MDDIAAAQHKLSHVCSNRDGCDRNFVLDSIEWFAKKKHDEFYVKIKPLIFTNGIPPGFSEKCDPSE